ncbi:jg20890 [Pararge aegeria aegeria]|uniref:Jg20890 protein n=1 Tax=Pararge aegeria aegeria TaxID=348720 RepID=A0A8S4RIM0_9NEOP|nr:jg20890 [Pararge aegeria aegeria]
MADFIFLHNHSNMGIKLKGVNNVHYIESGRCEDNPQIGVREAALRRADGHHGSIGCREVHTAQHPYWIQINVEPSRGPSPRRRHPRIEVSHFPPDVVELWGSSHGELSRSSHSPDDAVETPQVFIGKCPSENRTKPCVKVGAAVQPDLPSGEDSGFISEGSSSQRLRDRVFRKEAVETVLDPEECFGPEASNNEDPDNLNLEELTAAAGRRAAAIIHVATKSGHLNGIFG